MEEISVESPESSNNRKVKENVKRMNIKHL